MADLKEATVPDIGDYSDVPVIEILVAVGDTVEKDQGLVTLESDKATMEVPSSVAGVIKELKVKVGDAVSEGSVVAVIETAGGDGDAKAKPAQADAEAPAPAPAPASRSGAKAAPAASSGGVQEAKVPDIGDYSDVPVIEVLVAVGDSVAKDQGLVTLESDKATMEVPSTVAGVVKEVKVKVGDAVSEGSVVALVESEGEAEGDGEAKKPASASPASAPAKDQDKDKDKDKDAAPADARGTPGAAHDDDARAPVDKAATVAASADAGPGQPPVRFDADAVLPDKVPYASPAVRLFARELGVDLGRLSGSARGGRITREDVQKFVKGVMAGGASAAGGAPTGGGGLNLLPWPKVDFAKFGEIEVQPLSRIKKISGANLARNWAVIPHVTHQDDADITDLEALRVQLNKEAEKAAARGGKATKLTMLAFLMKASVAALKQFPEFNASLDASGEHLTLKKYFHIGFAADTPGGLVVPVVRDCDRKGINEIADESAALARKARDGKLGPAEMSGGCFSISSLGGIGGTAFTPIVNAPEVAILGVTRSAMKPVWDGKAFQPRLILPLSLSYDHRVVDGAAAARFTAYLAQLLGDMRRVLL